MKRTFKNILYKATSWMLTSALVRSIYWTIAYIQDWGQVAETIHGDGFKRVLKAYLNMDARIDWLGRVYGVVNPNLNDRGEFDISKAIFEVDGANTNNDRWVEHWLYGQMQLVSTAYDLDKTPLFDLIDAKIEHVGPENADNYLIIFDIASRKEMSRRWKRFLLQGIFEIPIIGYLISII